MRFNIKKRIYLSFSILVSMFVVNAVITLITINYNKNLTKHIAEVIDPSLRAMEEFDDMMMESKMYTTNWVFLRSNQDDKNALRHLHKIGYPALKLRLNNSLIQWKNKNWVDSMSHMMVGFEELLLREKYIMSSLNKFEDYDDPIKKFGSEEQLENIVLPMTAELVDGLKRIEHFGENLKVKENASLNDSSAILRILIVCLAIIIIIIGVFLSVYMTRKIIKPINKIRHIVNDLGKGIIQKRNYKENDDEIGEMAKSVNSLSEKISAAAAFAKKVGNRNFDAPFEPLSESDELGKAILSMRDNLKKSEKELHEANIQMQLFFRNIDQVFFSTDMTDNRLLQMSPACEKIYGYLPVDFSLNSNLWNEVILDEDKKIIQDNYPLLVEGKTVIMEYRIRHQDGSVRWVETNITPTLNQEGKLIRIDGVTSDICKRKEAEKILNDNNIELKKTNAELDKFVYSVSHDLRAPLSSMLGVVEIVEDETSDAFVLEHVGMLKGSINKLDGFIRDILEYSRNARLEVKKEEIDFKSMIDDIKSNLKYMGRSNRNVQIHTNIQSHLHLHSDKNRLSIVMNNLISNAIRYQDPMEKHPLVDVVIDMSDTETHIVVRDNGIGIKKELHDKIFDMFFRVSENSIGSGLGLYIVKETIDKLGGHIAVESELGKGTSFNVYLPNN